MSTHTPRLQIRYEDGHRQPVYRSVAYCPVCNGDGEYEGLAAIQSPTATEPRYDTFPCEVCGRWDRKGTGFLPVLRCVTCDGILPQDEIEAAQGRDADFEAALAEIDPEEEILWQRSPYLAGADLKRLTFCGCAPEVHGDTTRKISVIERAAVSIAAMGIDLDREGLTAGAPGIHHVPPGILFHLATGRPTLWKRRDAPAYARPHRASAPMRIQMADSTHDVTLFGDGMSDDHADWAVTANLAGIWTERG